MTGLAKPKIKIGVEDYFEGENSSEIRHEYIYGEVFAMSGTSDKHNRIVMNIGSKIDSHLENSKCETFIESLKLKADEQTLTPGEIYRRINFQNLTDEFPQ